ncbi:SMP-30/gluconolactonase/LRE family protein [Sphingobacterium sp. SGR-19]|uniref:SMP-30/gluconolactonase/LRE family protein n=1 Tax=Sphingobacterium sp. SGR-19 TaxID=2710886 RepID=UPI0013EA2577|nr:SMP-30/gluconolactonase/LRE family protein [Sphingobacterium sp. SGR-19]NGM63777.1 SMP-30/gluconolactonase/LRE family protein [Sphingobacterium sp. SGR-19]
MTYDTTGHIERYDAALDAIIDSSAIAEIIAEGFEWSEGPLWIESEQMLLFSDVPTNTIYKWTTEDGSEVYVKPSGDTSDHPNRRKEPGSNGLLLDDLGNLVLCQHGNRQIARMDATLQQPKSNFISLVDKYDDKRLNSPNDAVYNKEGVLFFTDPPYGLPTQRDDDPEKEIPFNGVYKVKQNGEVMLLTDKISKPNGIAFFPDGQKLLIGNSDPNAANWYILDLTDTAVTPKLFYSATNERGGLPGLPDGLKIDSNGIVYASGPGGIWIFDSTAKVLGKIALDEAASNVALSSDEKTLYITNSGKVLRIGLK